MIETYNHLQLSLDAFEVTIADFCKKFHFEARRIGRYPRVRISKQFGDKQIFMDLWMVFDERGAHLTTWDEHTEFELSGGVDIVRVDKSGVEQVHYEIVTEWENLPHFSAVQRLAESLDTLRIKLCSLEDSDIFNSGKVRGGPKKGNK